MDSKTWRWRKKSPDNKSFDKVNNSLSRIDEEVETLSSNGEFRSRRAVKNLSEKLASVLVDCPAKDDDSMASQAKKGQEAIAGQEKAELEAILMVKELDEMKRVVGNEKMIHSDAALKECIQQLEFVRKEQELRTRGAVMKASSELDNEKKALEEKLSEANRRLDKLAVENTHLTKALLVKDKLVEDLQQRKSQAEAEFSALLVRSDSTEKENAFLKYEFHVLEKELEIRNEEMEYNRRSADLAHKQYLEGVKKISKLEAECQKLRLMMRKRLPGPAAMLKMRSEVEILGRDRMEMRKKKMNPGRELIVRDPMVESSHEFPRNKVNLLIEQLHDVQEENKNLKEIIIRMNPELYSSKVPCSQPASRVLQVDALLKELSVSKGQKSMELAMRSSSSNEVSLISGFDISSDDGGSSSGSWASALISELEHFRDERLRNSKDCRVSGISEMSLMDDFVEMEKLAIISVETPSNQTYHPTSTSTELVPVTQGDSNFNDVKQMNSKEVAAGESFDWLQVVLQALLEQARISKQSLEELLEDIRIALSGTSLPNTEKTDKMAISGQSKEFDPLHISGYITWKSPNTSPVIDPSSGTLNIDTQCNLHQSISKIIKLVAGINIKSLDSNHACDNWSDRDQSSSPLASSADYFVCIFQSDLEKFANELSSVLDWILNNYTTPKDAFSSRDKSKKHFGQNNPPNDDKVKAGEDLYDVSEADNTCTERGACLKQDQIENQKFINEELDTQLSVAKVKLNEVFQRFSSLEVELEYKNHCCEELEATCLELQLQLESVAKKEPAKYSINQDGMQSENGWEITAASVKLAECQETIMNLGKQLKALATPRDAVLLDKVFSATCSATAASNYNKKLHKRTSLRDQMLAEDGFKADVSRSSNTRGASCIEDSQAQAVLPSNACNALVVYTTEASSASKTETRSSTVVASLPVVPSPSKKQGVGFLRRLLVGRKKGSGKKPRSSISG
ncbi:filament-like plant protein 7 [Carica papaya]|uniref:filament-like plant protein 7 n=1 Tax=Carica papaya TaxID=3649 RepID=UPI000B8CEED6|nr:filament-like plant protein 7 [Carica papaya]